MWTRVSLGAIFGLASVAVLITITKLAASHGAPSWVQLVLWMQWATVVSVIAASAILAAYVNGVVKATGQGEATGRERGNKTGDAR